MKLAVPFETQSGPKHQTIAQRQLCDLTLCKVYWGESIVSANGIWSYIDTIEYFISDSWILQLDCYFGTQIL